MILSRLFLIGLGGVMVLGCGEDDVPLHVDLEYQSNCLDTGEGGCPTRDHDIAGNAGDPIVGTSGVVGAICEIVNAGETTVLTNLTVQDEDLNVTLPNNGIHITNGRIEVGAAMRCEAGNGFQLFEGNQFNGSCIGYENGNCDVQVIEYTSGNGRLVLTIDCRNLVGIGEERRSIADGVVTVQGCNVTNDSR
jgi:hypothetical protein